MAKKKRPRGRPPRPLDLSTFAGRLGAQIQAARIRASLSADTLATTLGVDYRTIWKWERGERAISIEALDTLATACNTTAAKLMAAAKKTSE